MTTELLEIFLMKFDKKNTCISYNGSLKSFYNYLIEEKKFSFDKDEDMIKSLTIKEVREYLKYIKNKGYKKSTINHKIECIKEFFDFLVKARIIPFNLADTIKLYKQEDVKNDTEIKYIPTKGEIIRLLRTTYEKKIDARNQDYISARDRFYIALLATTGLRADNETLGIKMDEIEAVDGGYMINIHKDRVKNGIDKRVPVPHSIVKYFEEYKVQRMLANEKFNTDLLFFSSRGKKMSSDNMNDRIKELCERANIKENITNHSFRHFLMQHLRSNGVDKSMVYKILGWKEAGIDANYDRNINIKIYDKEKLRVCDVFR